ncbi:hypothetical protein Salat_0104400 [Sesamum alatum]|uniref:Uncharacterized protein n=1 Tax=Sesamum alatum TaxID=300844 RepID=A0AAE2CXH7_9LAMI|nr:hypothetical protein Salat_0104400 [Sesamum alatum]
MGVANGGRASDGGEANPIGCPVGGGKMGKNVKLGSGQKMADWHVTGENCIIVGLLYAACVAFSSVLRSFTDAVWALYLSRQHYIKFSFTVNSTISLWLRLAVPRLAAYGDVDPCVNNAEVNIKFLSTLGRKKYKNVKLLYYGEIMHEEWQEGGAGDIQIWGGGSSLEGSWERRKFEGRGEEDKASYRAVVEVLHPQVACRLGLVEGVLYYRWS